MTGNFDDAYGTPDWFGAAPHPVLPAFADRLPEGAQVLDIGVGQGRHALPLARRGCRVLGLDTSQAAVDQVEAAARAEGLDCRAILADVFAWEPDEPLDGVLCFGFFQMLPPQRVSALAERLKRWVKPGGTLWVTAWHTGDPRAEAPGDRWERVGPRAWRDPAEGRDLFYFHPEELLDLFPGWQVLHHHEGLGPPHRHGDGPEERHGEIQAVLGRPTKPLVDAWTRLGGAGL